MMDRAFMVISGGELSATIGVLRHATPRVTAAVDSMFVRVGITEHGRERTTAYAHAWSHLWPEVWRLLDEFGGSPPWACRFAGTRRGRGGALVAAGRRASPSGPAASSPLPSIDADPELRCARGRRHRLVELRALREAEPGRDVPVVVCLACCALGTQRATGFAKPCGRPSAKGAAVLDRAARGQAPAVSKIGAVGVHASQSPTARSGPPALGLSYMDGALRGRLEPQQLPPGLEFAQKVTDPDEQRRVVREAYRTIGCLLDDLPDPALLVDALCKDFPIVGASKGFCDLTGYTTE
ncbi:unnamed protein product, partial [Prorocentrum cordatum]